MCRNGLERAVWPWGKGSLQDPVAAVHHQRSSSSLLVEPVAHTAPSFASKTTCGAASSLPGETRSCPYSRLPAEGATCFIKTKEITSAKPDSVTTCHFTSAGTCQRMTQKAATCHPLTEHIKLLFGKHFNSSQGRFFLYEPRCCGREREREAISFPEPETTEEDARLQRSPVKNRPSTISTYTCSSPSYGFLGTPRGRGMSERHR